jgi:hypothetical protein
MGVASKGGKAPDRGSFPLDHFSECKCAAQLSFAFLRRFFPPFVREGTEFALCDCCD